MSSRPIPLEEASHRLPELVKMASRGQEVVLGDEAQALARLVGVQPTATLPRKFGKFRGKIHLSEGFDEELPESFLLGNDLE